MARPRKRQPQTQGEPAGQKYRLHGERVRGLFLDKRLSAEQIHQLIPAVSARTVQAWIARCGWAGQLEEQNVSPVEIARHLGVGLKNAARNISEHAGGDPDMLAKNTDTYVKLENERRKVLGTSPMLPVAMEILDRFATELVQDEELRGELEERGLRALAAFVGRFAEKCRRDYAQR